MPLSTSGPNVPCGTQSPPSPSSEMHIESPLARRWVSSSSQCLWGLHSSPDQASPPAAAILTLFPVAKLAAPPQVSVFALAVLARSSESAASAKGRAGPGRGCNPRKSQTLTPDLLSTFHVWLQRFPTPHPSKLLSHPGPHVVWTSFLVLNAREQAPSEHPHAASGVWLPRHRGWKRLTWESYDWGPPCHC